MRVIQLAYINEELYIWREAQGLMLRWDTMHVRCSILRARILPRSHQMGHMRPILMYREAAQSVS